MRAGLSRLVGLGCSCAALGWTLGRWSGRNTPDNDDSSSKECPAPAVRRFPACPLPSSLLVSAAAVPDVLPPHQQSVAPPPPAPSKPSTAAGDSSSLASTAATATVDKSRRVGEIMRYGFPSLDVVRAYDDFVLAYDRRNRVPAWVFEHLTAASIRRGAGVERAHCSFHADSSLHAFFRAENADYRGSGYDRGHLAAAGNHAGSQQLMQQTFVLSNMTPQQGVGFNRGKWNELEQHVRRMCSRYQHVYVCSGPLYLPQQQQDGKLRVIYEVIGANHVAVPTHFFKVVVGESADARLDMETYVLPNRCIDDATPLASFLVPLESVERAAGLLFFDKAQRGQLRLINGR